MSALRFARVLNVPVFFFFLSARMGNDVIDTSFIPTTVGLLRRGEKQLKARWRLTDYTRKKETEPAPRLESYRC